MALPAGALGPVVPLVERVEHVARAIGAFAYEDRRHEFDVAGLCDGRRLAGRDHVPEHCEAGQRLCITLAGENSSVLLTDSLSGGDGTVMRIIHTFLGLSLVLVACDLPDIGESGSTTSGGDSGPVTGKSTSIGSATVTGADPTTPTDTTSPTAGGACPPFDPGPVGDPHETYSYECFCDSCELSFEDIPLETLQTFESDALCDCLCAEAGCGGVQGEGGVATGSPTGSESDSDCAESDSDGSWPETDGGTTDSVPDTDGGTTDSVPETGGGTTDSVPETDGGTSDGDEL